MSVIEGISEVKILTANISHVDRCETLRSQPAFAASFPRWRAGARPENVPSRGAMVASDPSLREELSLPASQLIFAGTTRRQRREKLFHCRCRACCGLLVIDDHDSFLDAWIV